MTDKDIEQVARALLRYEWSGADLSEKSKDEEYANSKKYWDDSAIVAIDALKSLGWLSPADATAMAQAAQVEALEKVIQFHETEQEACKREYEEALQHFELSGRSSDYGVVMERATSIQNVHRFCQKAIRALTPASGPWQRVPEGSVVVPKEITEQMRYAAWFDQGKSAGGDDKHAAMLADKYCNDDEQRKIDQSAYRAMLAEVKK